MSTVALALDGTAAPEAPSPRPCATRCRSPPRTSWLAGAASRCPWHAVPPLGWRPVASAASTAQATRPGQRPGRRAAVRRPALGGGAARRRPRRGAGLLRRSRASSSTWCWGGRAGRSGPGTGCCGTRVVALARCGDRAELGWWDDRRWAGELARLVAPPASTANGRRGLGGARLRVPAELLLGVRGGAAPGPTGAPGRARSPGARRRRRSPTRCGSSTPPRGAGCWSPSPACGATAAGPSAC